MFGGMQFGMGMPMMGGGMPMMGMGGGMPMMGMGMNPMQGMFMMLQMMMMMQLMQQMMGQAGGGGMGGGMPGCLCGFPGMGGGGGGMMPGMPWGGFPGGGTAPGGLTGPQGPIPYNPVTGNRLADMAGAWEGRHFKPGQTHRCADFVSTMIEQSGAAPPGFRHQVSCQELQRYGRPVGRDQLRPGDVVFFGNTYRRGQYTHVGIYLGNGRFAHRPTANRPVRVDNLNSGYYASRFTGGRRLNG